MITNKGETHIVHYIYQHDLDRNGLDSLPKNVSFELFETL